MTIDKFEPYEVTLCSGCNCMTYSIRKGRAKYICGKCGHDKSLGDYFQYESKQKEVREKCNYCNCYFREDKRK